MAAALLTTALLITLTEARIHLRHKACFLNSPVEVQRITAWRSRFANRNENNRTLHQILTALDPPSSEGVAFI